jgi:DnaJ-class molecular chaperone
MCENYYKVLEINPFANDKIIRAAYRKLARRFHPDKNPKEPELAASRFIKIDEAFKFLSNKSKRAGYDEMLARSLHASSLNAESTNNRPQAKRQKRKQPTSTLDLSADQNCKTSGSSVTQIVLLTLEQIYGGASFQFNLTLNDKTELVQITFPPGTASGSSIIHQSNGTLVRFVAQELPHDRFTREADDLIRKVQINLTEVLVGTDITVTCIDSTTYQFNSMEQGIVYPGYRKRIKGKGMPTQSNPMKFGDLIVEFDVKFPVSNAWFLTDAQKQKIKEAHACFQSEVKNYYL